MLFELEHEACSATCDVSDYGLHDCHVLGSVSEIFDELLFELEHEACQHMCGDLLAEWLYPLLLELEHEACSATCGVSDCGLQDCYVLSSVSETFDALLFELEHEAYQHMCADLLAEWLYPLLLELEHEACSATRDVSDYVCVYGSCLLPFFWEH